MIYICCPPTPACHHTLEYVRFGTAGLNRWDDEDGRESEVGISVARLLLGLIVRLAECPVSSADSSVGMTALADAVEKGLRNGLNDDSC